MEPLEDFFFSHQKYSGISTIQFCFHSFWNRPNFGGFLTTIRIIHFLCCELDKAEFLWEIRFLFDSFINGFWTMKIVFYHIVMDVVVLFGLQNRRKVARKGVFHWRTAFILIIPL